MTRIAFLSPLPPERTGVADYARTVLLSLGALVEVDAFCVGRADRIPGVRIRRATRRGLQRLETYDAVVAQVGNSVAHGWIVDALRIRPATVVLHELVLHHLVAALTIGRGDPERYLKEMRTEAGAHGVSLAHQALRGNAAPLWETSPERFPLADFVVRNALALGVHSKFLAASAGQRWPHLETTVIPFPVVPAPLAERRPTEVGGEFRIGVFGFITAHKRLPVILDAFALVRHRVPRARLVIVGDAPLEVDVQGLVQARGLADVVEITGYSSSSGFDRLLGSVDIGVNLRVPTLGETSAVVTGLLAKGTPVIVSRGGWYDELPDAAVARVPSGPDEVLELAATIEWLAGDAERRHRMGQAAHDYAVEQLSPDRTAEAYVRAVLGPAGRLRLESDLLVSLATAIRDVADPSANTRDLSAKVVRAGVGLGLLSPTNLGLTAPAGPPGRGDQPRNR